MLAVQLDFFDGVAGPPSWVRRVAAEEEHRQTCLRDRVFRLMRDGVWRTLPEMVEVVGGLSTGVSAKLRDLRKREYGGHIVVARPKAGSRRGLMEYRVEETR
jgi:hypothetical protein